MAVLQGIVCHGIYFDKLGGKFCAIAELPSDPARFGWSRISLISNQTQRCKSIFFPV
jgi:hypothetical protein